MRHWHVLQPDWSTTNPIGHVIKQSLKDGHPQIAKQNNILRLFKYKVWGTQIFLDLRKLFIE